MERTIKKRTLSRGALITIMVIVMLLVAMHGFFLMVDSRSDFDSDYSMRCYFNSTTPDVDVKIPLPITEGSGIETYSPNGLLIYSVEDSPYGKVISFNIRNATERYDRTTMRDVNGISFWFGAFNNSKVNCTELHISWGIHKKLLKKDFSTQDDESVWLFFNGLNQTNQFKFVLQKEDAELSSEHDDSEVEEHVYIGVMKGPVQRTVGSWLWYELDDSIRGNATNPWSGWNQYHLIKGTTMVETDIGALSCH